MEKMTASSPAPSAETLEAMTTLANEIESLKDGDDRMIDRLCAAIRTGNVERAKVFCRNESDKFSPYRATIVPLLITKLFQGQGSPWPSIERTLNERSSE